MTMPKHPNAALIMTLKDGTRYELTAEGDVLYRSDGPWPWDYSGKWRIVGFKKRHHSLKTISLAEVLAGEDVGQGWICDLDNGTYRLWGSPRLRKLATIVPVKK
jgi:hypothetical protein